MKKFLVGSILCLLCSACFIFVGCEKDKDPFKVNFIVDNEIVSTIETFGNEILTLPENPNKECYNFKGWYWDENYELPFNENSIKDVSLSKDLNIYARFEISANGLWQRVEAFQNIYVVNANNERNNLSVTQTIKVNDVIDETQSVKGQWYDLNDIQSMKFEYFENDEIREYRIYYKHQNICYSYRYSLEDDTYSKEIEDENYSEATCEFQTSVIISMFSSSMYDSTEIINFEINNNGTYTFYLETDYNGVILNCEVLLNENGMVLKEKYTYYDDEDDTQYVSIMDYNYNNDITELQEQINVLISDNSDTEKLCLINQHDWYLTQTINPTCTENGTKYYACHNCDSTKEEIIKSEHDWFVYSTINATCEENGAKLYKCHNCTDTKYEDIYTVGHHCWSVHSITFATCDTNGVSYLICDRCRNIKQEIIYASGQHSWYIDHQTNSCTKSGKIYYKCHHCVETKQEQANPIGHDWYVYSTIDATCTENGIQYYSCNNCDAKKEETLIARGHDMVIMSEFNPTCKIEGEITKHCENGCGHTLTETEEIQNKANHEYLAIGSTCSSCGYKCIDNDENAVLLYDEETQKYCAEYYGTMASNIYNNYDLTAVYFANKIVTITTSAFEGQYCLKTIIFEENSQLETISYGAFMNCDSLAIIDLSNCSSLTAIYDHAFSYCDKVNSIDLSYCTSLITIGYNAFRDCSNLTNIDFPDSLKYVGKSAFDGTKVTFITQNEVNYIGTTTNPYMIAYSAKSNGLTQVELNESCKIIADDTFYGCSYLEYIVIPNGIYGIGSLCYSSIKKYYLGTSEDWKNVYHCDSSNCENNENTYFYVEDDEALPNGSGTFWHYDTDGVTPIIWE